MYFRSRASTTQYPNVVFWLCFLSLNFLLFVPLYLLDQESSTFLPVSWDDSWSVVTHKLIFWRNNFDLFRVNIEFVLLITLWILLGRIRHRAIQILFTVVYFLAFYYYIYESVSLSIFLVDPIFYNQYFMAVDGLRFLANHVSLLVAIYLLAICGFIVLHLIILILIRIMMGRKLAEQLNIWTRLALIAIGFGLLVLLVRYQVTLANPLMAASSVYYKIQKNIHESLASYSDVALVDNEVIQTTYNYSDYQLREKPNIYLIVIESYGSILYKRDDFRKQYVALMAEIDEKLEEHQWYTASNLSVAPTWGGGSWMSYASLLFGLHIDTHPQFLHLLNRYRYRDYPDLGHYLKSQGYKYYRLSALSVEMTSFEWEKYQSFYGVDEWLRYRDLGFRGRRYSWGPSPPDQYSVNFMHDYMVCNRSREENNFRENSKTGQQQPFFFFYVTQNSHYPWSPMPPLAEDWRTLNEPQPDAVVESWRAVSHEVTRRNYMAAMDYQLRFLVDFITKQGDEQSIFILVGDHQPPRVARRADGFETQIHIVSQNADLATRFIEHGFVKGMRVHSLAKSIKHEGFYSLFMHTLVSTYGKSVETLPPYLPDGVQFE
ncbi:hypothetical protein KFU94_54080 [Chloroflexi bacterium TSY]|nr:hypothetical protein [Chloroflexi bacterium TSY]